MDFSRQEYWTGLPFPSPEDLPDPGIKPGSPTFRQTLYHLNHQGSLNKQTNTKINKIPEPVRVRKVNGIGLGSVQFSSVTQSCLTLCNPIDCSQAPLSMGFSRQEYWSGLPFPSPEDLPDPGIERGSPALRADASPSDPPGRSIIRGGNKNL